MVEESSTKHAKYFFGSSFCSIHWDYSDLPYLVSGEISRNSKYQTYLLIGAILTTGSMIVTWLGEQITDKGYGNGVSMIIFAGIVSSIPEMIKEIYENAFVNVRSGQMTNSPLFCWSI